MKAAPLAVVVLLETTLISAPLRAENISLSLDRASMTDSAAMGTARLQPVAFGDPTTSGHHHRRAQDSTSSSQPVQPQKHAPQQETEEQHQQYLKRYGF